MGILSPEKKVEMIKRHVVEGQAVSKLCEEYGVKPKSYYEWQKIFFEQGFKVFEGRSSGITSVAKQQDTKLQYLENKLKEKDEVLAEVMHEYVSLKKRLGVS